MLFERPATQKYIVGFDLRDDACQISYLPSPKSQPFDEPTTFTLMEGEELYDIPTAIAKLIGQNRWMAGKEAVNASSNGSATFIPQLLTRALENRPVQVEESQYEPTALLSLYIRRCLALISSEVPTDDIQAIMFTVREMDERMVAVFESVKKRLDLPCPVYCESYASSFYNYLLMQEVGVREPGSCMIEYDAADRLRIGRMQFNRHTRPEVAFMETEEFPGLISRDLEDKDEELLRLVQGQLKGSQYASVFLIGNGFLGGWMKKSISYLCRGRRVFMGSNLFSKGAVYGALYREFQVPITKDYYFLDDGKLTTNIGVKAVYHGENTYYSLLDAGVNWYEAKETKDLIIEDGNDLYLTLKPLTGGTSEDFLIRLDGLPVREGRTARIRLFLSMDSPDRVRVEIHDLGFGEIFPSTGSAWEQLISLK